MRWWTPIWHQFAHLLVKITYNTQRLCLVVDTKWTPIHELVVDWMLKCIPFLCVISDICGFNGCYSSPIWPFDAHFVCFMPNLPSNWSIFVLNRSFSQNSWRMCITKLHPFRAIFAHFSPKLPQNALFFDKSARNRHIFSVWHPWNAFLFCPFCPVFD